MGYFKEGRSKRKVNLLSNPDYWVEIYTDIKWGQSKKALTVTEDGNIDMVLSADKLLGMLIIGWNLDDEAGNILEVNQENIDRLEPADALHLAKAAGADEAAAKSAKKDSAKS